MITKSRTQYLPCSLQPSLGGERGEKDFQAINCVVLESQMFSQDLYTKYGGGTERKGSALEGQERLYRERQTRTQSHWKNTAYQLYIQWHETAW